MVIWLPYQQSMWLILVIQRKLCAKYELIPLKTKERLRYHSGYYGSIVTIATGYLGDT